MKIVSMAKAGICCLTVGLLAGCVPPAQVKDVLADQTGFLDANFSPDKLPGPVRDAVMHADPGPLAFHKMVLHLDWTVDANEKAKAVHIDQTMTVTNAGGSFTRMIEQDSRNGIAISQQDSLSYRGLLELRTQHFSMDARNGKLAITLHDLKEFDPITPAATTLQYIYTVGTSVQLMNFLDGHVTCKFGRPYPASWVFSTFSGQARDAQCTMYNSNGAVARKDRYAYLESYGLAVRLEADLTSGMSEAKVVAASIQ
jgi:hypothetical protein